MKETNSIMAQNDTHKAMSLTCTNCERLSEIEGEKVCFDHGKITRLTELNTSDAIIKMVCNSWSKNS
ncbi:MULTISPECIES: hypothetical protein [Shewanella]|nr:MULTISPECIES: hypothetical protein [Shewanella]